MCASLNTHIENCKHQLRQTYPHLDMKIINNRTSFIIHPEKICNKSIVLIHDLLDSCFILRNVAQIFMK